MISKIAKTVLKSIVTSKVSKIIASRNFGRDLFFLIARNYTPSVVSNVTGITYNVSTSDRTVGREVFLTGGFDAQCIKQVFDILDSLGYKEREGKIFLDVGANIGTTTLPAIKVFGFSDAIAFEPEPNNYKLLRQNIVANDLEKHIQTLNVAVSDKEATVSFEVCAVNSGDSRVRAEVSKHIDNHYQEDVREVISVRAITLDSFLTASNVSADDIGLAWIDTQGHEGHVLNGAQSLLNTKVPVLVEYWPYALARADGLELLEQNVMSKYTHFIDIREVGEDVKGSLTPSSKIRELREKYQGTSLTDILLLKV